jgi:hypothetical protein
MSSYFNFFHIIIILIIFIIIINILGGSINFYDYISYKQNDNKPQNVEAFLQDEEVYNIINKITSKKPLNEINNKKSNKVFNNNDINSVNSVNSVNDINDMNSVNNVNDTNMKTIENFQSMNELEPMSAKKNDSNIQSNLITICNQTQNDFHSLLQNSP